MEDGMTNPIREEWVSADGQHRIIWGDCLECLKVLDTSEVAAVLADPPYGIGHQCDFASRGRGSTCGTRSNGKPVWNSPRSNDYPDVTGDAVPFDPSPLLSLDKPTVLWGANWYADKLPPSGGWLIWDKDRPDDLDQATCELAWTNCVKGVRRLRHLWNGMMRASEHGENYHPTQKPVALCRWVMSLRWIPSGLILDPYAGSCTVAVACARTGRRSISIEIEEKYFRVGIERMEREAARHPLFEPAKPTQKALFSVQ